MSRKASTASPKPATATRTLDRSRDAFASGQRTNARPSRASSKPELAASVGISGDSFNAETWLPAGRRRFRLDEFAKLLRCSSQHLFTLIVEGELRVPKKAIAIAPSRSSILISRKSVVDFINNRHSSEYLKRKRARQTESVGVASSKQPRKYRGKSK